MSSERGAGSVVMATGALVLLLGVAAVAVDLSLVFNERNQDQNAADNAVMAGALEKALSGDPQVMAIQTLSIARENLRNIYGTSFNSTEWVELWRSCDDPDNSGWTRIPEPTTWAAISTPTPPSPDGTLDCISQTSGFFKVRIPDQLVDAEFARIWGVDTLSTKANAIAKLDRDENAPPIVPFGISGAAGPGELCFSSSGSGTAYLPCVGPSNGTFGTILSEFFGQFYGTVDCGNPGATNVEVNTAIGVDHYIEEWPGSGVPIGSPHPGDNYVLNTLPDTNRDDCNNVGGFAVGVDGDPPNTLKVDPGFSGSEIERGLVSESGPVYDGEPSRLQQWDEAGNPHRTIVAKRLGGPNVEEWELDNRGPWYYLLEDALGANSNCDRSTYPGLPTADKLLRIKACLADYLTAGSTVEIFDAAIAESPRFVYAPQYVYALPTTGLSWEPIHQFRASFIAGVWFNCSAGSCGAVFYPDEEETSEVCDPSPGNKCKQLNLGQMSAWYLPDSALPASIQPGPGTPLEPSLWQ